MKLSNTALAVVLAVAACSPVAANAAPAAQLAPPVHVSAPNVSANATILMYHHIAVPPQSLAPLAAQYFVDPSAFGQQIYYLLANGFSIVSLERVVEALEGGSPLPAKAVAITIDDGWQDFWQNGLAVVQQYLVPVTLFVIADSDGGAYMTLSERQALAHAGVDVEAHTLTHPFLTRLAPEEADSQVVASKKAIEKELGLPVRLFAYPYGDFNSLVITMVKGAGYSAAFAGGPAPDESSSNLYQLPRVMVSRYDTPATFGQKVVDYRWARTHPVQPPAPPAPSPTVAPTPAVDQSVGASAPAPDDSSPPDEVPVNGGHLLL